MDVDEVTLMCYSNGWRATTHYADQSAPDFTWNMARCPRQAIYGATQGRKKKLRLRAILTMKGGEVVPFTDEQKCDVSRSDWTWQHHGFTHRIARGALVVGRVYG